MDYRNKVCLVTGASGFIGSALATKLEHLGAIVLRFDGDVRSFDYWREYCGHELDYIFHFGSPSSQVLFKRNIEYCIEATIQGFMNAVKLAKLCNAKLIYPSTGLVAQDRYNEYARCKKVLEDIHLNSGIYALGLRIYAGFGEGEAHKADYASPIYIFARDMMNCKRPVIWGDGKQKRDFIYIDDLTNYIVRMAEEHDEPIAEIGSGQAVSFNEVIKLINRNLEVKIKPKYIKKPANYYDETLCDTTKLFEKYGRPHFSLEEGIQQCLKSL